MVSILRRFSTTKAISVGVKFNLIILRTGKRSRIQVCQPSSNVINTTYNNNNNKGPSLFCLTIHPIIHSLSLPLSISYMDDLTLGGSSRVVAQDVELISRKGAEVGL